MFISKVSLKPGPELFELLKQDDPNNSYVSHQILWNLFPNDGYMKRDFLFYKIEKAELPQYLMVSKYAPLAIGGVFVDSKPYTPCLEDGQKLAFSITANPVVSKKTEGRVRSVKHDVWMDAKKKAQNRGVDKTSIFQACEDASKRWLIEQGGSRGFIVNNNDFIIDGYIQNRIYKKKNGKVIRFSSIHYEGVLKVTDTEKFLSTLYKGLGRAKAFGCGLMLVKRV